MKVEDTSAGLSSQYNKGYQDGSADAAAHYRSTHLAWCFTLSVLSAVFGMGLAAAVLI